MSSPPLRNGIPFLKGHGTENDFVVIPDRNDSIEISAEQVRAICDRRAGIGCDGVIRVAPSPDGHYFMDYRNADGSYAEMCGNGARLLARFLVDSGWEGPGRFEFGTRGGTRTAELDLAGDVTIEMGPVRVGVDTVAGLAAAGYPGTVVDVGNPHLVCFLPTAVSVDLLPTDLASDGLAALDLARPPTFDGTLFPHGVNVEFAQVNGPDEVRMRVHERGVGETRSCGTGTVAVAAAYLRSTGRLDGTVRVAVPGGRVVVDLRAGTVAGEFGESTLTGPAVFVAAGQIDPVLLGAG